MEYKELNDNELIYMINEDSEDAYELICKKYKSIVYKLAHKYSKGCSNVGIDINDLILEGNIGLDNAIRCYKEDNANDASFKSFLYLCVERQIISLIRRSTIKKNHILNTSTHYDSETLNNIKDTLYIEPLEKIILNEDEKVKYNKLIKKFTPLETKIFLLKLRNYSNPEIEQILNIDIKCIRNTTYRIRKKAKQIFAIQNL